MHSSVDQLRRAAEEASRGRLFMLVFLVMFAVYVPTASYSQFNTDTFAASVAASNLAWSGDLTLDDFPGTPWTVEAQGRTVSGRFPGVIFMAAPFFRLLGAQPEEGAGRYPVAVGSFVAALLSAVAVATLFLVFHELVGGWLAVLAALVAGLGTSTWSVSANELWTHGPHQLWLAVAALFLARGRTLVSGLGFGAAIITRPPTALAAAITGIFASWYERDLRPLILLGAGAGLGLLGLLLYNRQVFGTLSLTGAYGGYESEIGEGRTFIDTVVRMPLSIFVWNIVGTVFSPSRGIFATSPFLILLLPGIPAAWRRSPRWAKALAFAGLGDLLLHLRANTYTGASGFFSYRIPLGGLTLMAPFLLLCYSLWTAQAERRRLAFAILGSSAIVIHGTAAILDVRY